MQGSLHHPIGTDPESQLLVEVSTILSDSGVAGRWWRMVVWRQEEGVSVQGNTEWGQIRPGRVVSGGLLCHILIGPQSSQPNNGSIGLLPAI